MKFTCRERDFLIGSKHSIWSSENLHYFFQIISLFSVRLSRLAHILIKLITESDPYLYLQNGETPTRRNYTFQKLLQIESGNIGRRLLDLKKLLPCGGAIGILTSAKRFTVYERRSARHKTTFETKTSDSFYRNKEDDTSFQGMVLYQILASCW